jgi:hypothetical protein
MVVRMSSFGYVRKVDFGGDCRRRVISCSNVWFHYSRVKFVSSFPCLRQSLKAVVRTLSCRVSEGLVPGWILPEAVQLSLRIASYYVDTRQPF